MHQVHTLYYYICTCVHLYIPVYILVYISGGHYVSLQGRMVGISIGCFLGMFPLFWFNKKGEESI